MEFIIGLTAGQRFACRRRKIRMRSRLKAFLIIIAVPIIKQYLLVQKWNMPITARPRTFDEEPARFLVQRFEQSGSVGLAAVDNVIHLLPAFRSFGVQRFTWRNGLSLGQSVRD